MMVDHADNLLRNGFHSIEGMGKEARNLDLPNTFEVQDARSDDYDSYTLRYAGRAELLAPADPKRTQLKFQNNGPDTAVVGKLSAVQSGNGYMVPAGKDHSMTTTGQVYVATVVVGSAAVSTGSVWVERDDN